MTRDEKVLQFISKSGVGLEIGPSHSPFAPKRAGYNVDIIDHMSREELLVKYKDHNLKLDNIEEVDYVWQGQSYSELTGKPKHYDWIIASHLIEHTPDLIGFLNDCDAVLKDDGVLSLVIPDKRTCFDHFRPITGLATVVDSHFAGNKIHTPGRVAEYFLNVALKDGELGWHFGSDGTFQMAHTLQDAINGIFVTRHNNEYIDVHAWCFVPQSFRLMIHDLYSLGLISFQEVSYHTTDGYEFYVTLSRSGKGISQSRLEMLAAIELEVKELDRPSLKQRIAPSPPSPPASFATRVVRRIKRALKLNRSV